MSLRMAACWDFDIEAISWILWLHGPLGSPVSGQTESGQTWATQWFWLQGWGVFWTTGLSYPPSPHNKEEAKEGAFCAV
jgi:hypothetical protein